MVDRFIVPDVTGEPIIGKRCWGLGKPDGSILLISGAKHAVWPAKERMSAQCHSAHEPPGEDCTCGIYALAEAWPYYSYDGPGYAVWGEVALWGKIVEGDRGYRAHYAYPVALNLARKDWQYKRPLEASYGVPVRFGIPDNLSN